MLKKYYFTFVIFLLLNLCTAEEAKSQDECKDNEKFSCGNPHCVETCKTIGKPCNVAIFRCENHCFCEKEFVRNEKNVCIPKSEC
ncbi:hypothetical protein PVAND_010737 [Polypedilum vanderplanki]|uniref:TIL domain-containing protein n=1 Tax=Polypedilum vanderplanki TaxID=319348 RepID=A0A9J6CI84_POLVA|nr:hypothetical protein PVAND_010737 [Polypedilum vanderplanki]